MLFPLIKKDFLIIRKQLAILFFIVIALPFLMSSQSSGTEIHYYFFFVAMMCILMLYLQLSNIEDQYRGSAFFCATPFTRSTFITAKYLFIVAVFIGITLIQICISVFFTPIREGLTMHSVGITFLVLSLFLGVMIPMQLKFGNSMAKWILLMITLTIPFGSHFIIRWIQANQISLSINLPVPQIMQELLPVTVGVLIGIISLIISQKIYENKDL